MYICIMGRKSKFISLIETEKASLLSSYKNGKSHLFRRKCHCILLSSEGKTTSELATLFSVTNQSILKWFRRWEAGGIENLKLQAGRGRPLKLDIANKIHVDQVKVFIENDPQNLGKVQAQLSTALQIDFSKKTLQRFLKSLVMSGNVTEK